MSESARTARNSSERCSGEFCRNVRLEGVYGVDKLARALLQGFGFLGGKAYHEKFCVRREVNGQQFCEFFRGDAKLGCQGRD